jgi:hypothetical protein
MRASLVTLLLLCAGAQAQEREAYRYTDDSGHVMSAQTPPADGRDAAKVDIAPLGRPKAVTVAARTPPFKTRVTTPRNAASRSVP